MKFLDEGLEALAAEVAAQDFSGEVTCFVSAY